MADLFHNLAASSLGVAATIQPLIGPRFGPPPPIGGDPPEALPAAQAYDADIAAMALLAPLVPEGSPWFGATLPTFRQLGLALPTEAQVPLEPGAVIAPSPADASFFDYDRAATAPAPDDATFFDYDLPDSVGVAPQLRGHAEESVDNALGRTPPIQLPAPSSEAAPTVQRQTAPPSAAVNSIVGTALVAERAPASDSVVGSSAASDRQLNYAEFNPAASLGIAEAVVQTLSGASPADARALISTAPAEQPVAGARAQPRAEPAPALGSADVSGRAPASALAPPPERKPMSAQGDAPRAAPPTISTRPGWSVDHRALSLPADSSALGQAEDTRPDEAITADAPQAAPQHTLPPAVRPASLRGRMLPADRVGLPDQPLAAAPTDTILAAPQHTAQLAAVPIKLPDRMLPADYVGLPDQPLATAPADAVMATPQRPPLSAVAPAALHDQAVLADWVGLTSQPIADSLVLPQAAPSPDSSHPAAPPVAHAPRRNHGDADAAAPSSAPMANPGGETIGARADVPSGRALGEQSPAAPGIAGPAQAVIENDVQLRPLAHAPGDVPMMQDMPVRQNKAISPRSTPVANVATPTDITQRQLLGREAGELPLVPGTPVGDVAVPTDVIQRQPRVLGTRPRAETQPNAARTLARNEQVGLDALRVDGAGVIASSATSATSPAVEPAHHAQPAGASTPAHIQRAAIVPGSLLPLAPPITPDTRPLESPRVAGQNLSGGVLDSSDAVPPDRRSSQTSPRVVAGDAAIDIGDSSSAQRAAPPAAPKALPVAHQPAGSAGSALPARVAQAIMAANRPTSTVRGSAPGITGMQQPEVLIAPMAETVRPAVPQRPSQLGDTLGGRTPAASEHAPALAHPPASVPGAERMSTRGSGVPAHPQLRRGQGDPIAPPKRTPDTALPDAAKPPLAVLLAQPSVQRAAALTDWMHSVPEIGLWPGAVRHARSAPPLAAARREPLVGIGVHPQASAPASAQREQLLGPAAGQPDPIQLPIVAPKTEPVRPAVASAPRQSLPANQIIQRMPAPHATLPRPATVAGAVPTPVARPPAQSLDALTALAGPPIAAPRPALLRISAPAAAPSDVAAASVSHPERSAVALDQPGPTPTDASVRPSAAPAALGARAASLGERPISARREVAAAARTPASRAERRAQPAPAALPTIRITIGRVEVRSTPAPAPAPARRKESPRQGVALDEYLRSHRGGQR